MLIHRLRIVLRMTGGARLHFFQAAEVYALLAYAHGMASGIDSALPDGLMLDVPEQGRLTLASGNEFALGGTWLAGSEDESRGRLKRLIAALNEAGGTRGLRGAVFSDNFQVAFVEDLVAGQRFDGSRPLAAISSDHFADEMERLNGLPGPFTLRFTSPLRFHLPKGSRQPGHAFADHAWFDPTRFIERAAHRQQALGISGSESSPSRDSVSTRASLIQNNLVWLDFSYGPSGQRTQLGGALGTVVIDNLTPLDRERLVWGQYVAVGDNTRFGFGRYRLQELGPDPFPCRRTVSLLKIALRPTAVDEAAERYGVDSGECTELVRQVEQGTYRSAPPHQVTIHSGSRSRVLSIPARPDRVLQRAVHDLLAPALDLLFEESSLAFRRGLGRKRAADRLRAAVAEGFRWALRADIDDFFETINHQQLESRLRALLADDDTTDLLMEWVRCGLENRTQGLPTGAVISPLLANLFLDQFDEQIARAGGRLVRYADDFLILYRTEAEARAAHQIATEAAQALQLQLNSDKTLLLDLHEPFTFLGYRFQHDVEWRAVDTGPPRPVHELGWFDVGSQRDEAARTIALPGESVVISAGDRATLILGPGLKWLGFRSRRLQYGYGEGGQASGSVPVERLEHVLVIGAPTLYEELVREVSRHGIQITVLNEWCQPQARILGQDASGTPELLMAQTTLAADDAAKLAVARQLVAAKLRNYAVLADAVPGRKNDRQTGAQLREQARRVEQAGSLPELLGHEGAAAAIWYGRFSERLPLEFASTFERRVAPRAPDPVNALLNIAQTLLHRLIVAQLRASGLNPFLSCLHQPRSGHASLASDLQEPFRHLMDRAVIEATRRLLPGDFTTEPRRNRPEPFSDQPSDDPEDAWLRLRPGAARRFIEQVHRLLALGAVAEGSKEVAPYRVQIARLIRSYRHCLLHAGEPLSIFQHPLTGKTR